VKEQILKQSHPFSQEWWRLNQQIAHLSRELKEGEQLNSSKRGPCAKKSIVCTIIAEDGEQFTGENSCDNPQASCPRVGELYKRDDFTLCRSICQQSGHAEVMALKAAGPKAKGAIAIVEHHRVCDDCRQKLQEAGIKAVFTSTRLEL